MKGFDVSYWQGKLDRTNYVKANDAGYEFVIIRLGYNSDLNEDSTFETNYKAATKEGFTVGVYYYSTAKTEAQAKKEANFCLKKLNGRALQYPVFIDYEDKTQANLGRDKSKKICEAFCEIISAAGYAAGVYASYDFLTNRIAPINKKYALWLAQYPAATYKGRFELHQYSSSEKIPGIGNRIDADTSTLAPGSYPKQAAKKAEWPTLPTRGYFRKGDRGVNVRRMQERLNERGYDCGAADGIFGDRTLKGVKTFQKKNGLTVDGLFGRQSLNKLKTLKALKR